MMTEPRCYDHKYNVVMPACQTCHRIALERDIVTRTIDALLTAGYIVKESEDDTWHNTKEHTLALLFDLDDAFLMATSSANESNHTHSGWVRFVFGNDGWDVISDYTTNLEDVLKPVNDYVDSIAP